MTLGKIVDQTLFELFQNHDTLKTRDQGTGEDGRILDAKA